MLNARRHSIGYRLWLAWCPSFEKGEDPRITPHKCQLRSSEASPLPQNSTFPLWIRS